MKILVTLNGKEFTRLPVFPDILFPSVVPFAQHKVPEEVSYRINGWMLGMIPENHFLNWEWDWEKTLH